MVPGWPAAIRALLACCATRQTPVRFVSTMLAHSASVVSTNQEACPTPELLIRILHGALNSFSMAAKALVTESAEVTSIATANACPPSASISDASVFSLSRRRAAKTTVAPFLARVLAKCSPRPLEAPVTRACCPASDCSVDMFSGLTSSSDLKVHL